MKILLAPDKFKSSLTATQVCNAMAAGIHAVDPGIVVDACPMADGGEGTVAAMVAATSGKFVTRRVTGPLPEMKVDATFGLIDNDKVAVIEMSAAAGLHLLEPSQRNPMHTTTFGVGELLTAAVGLGVEKIILGIGGSATTDGGIGCAQACGLPVLLADGETVHDSEPLTGADLPKVLMIKRGRGSRIETVPILVASDVTNPLFGDNGAAKIFGPQKGASPGDVERLDAHLQRLATRTGKLDIAALPGAGAAGGLGFGMMAFFNAQLRPGIDIIADAVQLPRRLGSANLCITGEGRLDAQSLSGKTPIGVAKLCRAAGVPCAVIAGRIDVDAQQLRDRGIVTAKALSRIASPEECHARAADLIAKLASEIVRPR